MNIYTVRDGGPDRVTNTRYFWINESLSIDGDTRDFSNVLLVSNNYKFAEYQSQVFRICELGIDDDDGNGFIKVWCNDPFADYAGIEGFEHIIPLPGPQKLEYVI